jgi:hypothetical protein
LEKEIGFNYCVNPLHCKPEAHGNRCRVDTCSCGAVRKTNFNAGNNEIGSWQRPCTEAEKINKISDWVEAIEAAEAVCADKEQDSENEKTTFTFYDGSKMVFSGFERWVIDPIPKLL